jgi:hypothetical protein
MKKRVIFFLSLLYSVVMFSQNSDYENKLAQYMAEFQSGAYSQILIDDLIIKTETLKNQIGIQLNLNNSNSDEYRSLLYMQKKIRAFYNYISCFKKFSNNEYSKDEFDYINGILNIYPVELKNLKCDFATFYEISIGKLKATIVHNILKQTDYFNSKMIEVEYDCMYDSQIFQKGNFNLAGNNVQVVEYLNDNQNRFYKIVNVRCKETK